MVTEQEQENRSGSGGNSGDAVEPFLGKVPKTGESSEFSSYQPSTGLVFEKAGTEEGA